MPGTTELIIIAAIIFVLFGASAIPKFARSIRLAKKEFSAANEDEKKEKITGKNAAQDSKKEAAQA